jgi:hypothetical protein
VLTSKVTGSTAGPLEADQLMPTGTTEMRPYLGPNSNH